MSYGSKFSGINKFQGDPFSTAAEDMAGNLFFYNSFPDDYDDINNDGDFVDYMYSNYPKIGYNVEPKDYTATTVEIHGRNILLWDYTEACPSRLNGGPDIITGLKSEMELLNMSIDSITV